MRGRNHAGHVMPRKHRTVTRALSLLGVPLLLTGCAVGPNFTKPEAAVTAAWREKGDPFIATQTATDNLWWKAFNDPALNQLVDLAFQQNLPLQIAGLRIVEARAQLGIATGLQYPQSQTVSGRAVGLGITRQVAEVTRLDRNFVAYQVGFDAAWELDFWGKYRRGIEAETDNTIATVAEYYATVLSLTAEVARTYVVIRTYESLIGLAQENAKIQEEGLTIAQSRFRNGATSELDQAQAVTLLESTRATIPQLQIGLQQARNALSTLLGQPAGSVDALLAGPTAIPKAPATVVVSVPAEMLRRRPDIHSAELQAAAQCARIGVATAALYPSFSLFGSVGLQAASTGPTSHNLFSGDSVVYTIGPQISWPFFNYGRLTNNVRVQDARFQQLLVGYRNTVLKAAQEVEDGLVGVLNARQATVFQERSVTAARRSVQISLVEYREGAVDFQRVLDAQRSLLNEQNSLAQTTSSVATNLIALYKALGGGWELRMGEPIVSQQNMTEMKARTGWDDLLSTPSAPTTTSNAPPDKH